MKTITLYGLRGPDGNLAANIEGEPYLNVEKRDADELVRYDYVGHTVVEVQLSYATNK